MDNKRVLLAFVLSFGVLIAFRWAFPPATEEPVTPAPAATPSTAAVPAAASPQEAAAKAPGAADAGAQDIHADQVETTVVETPLYKATVSNEGGILKSFQLTAKNYDDAGRPLELINGVSATSVGWPLAFATGDPKLDSQLNRALYVVKKDGNMVSLEYAGEGIHALRVLEFDPDNYEFSLATTLERNGQPVSHQVLWQGGFGDQSVPDEPKNKHAVYDKDASFTRIQLAGIKDPADVTAALIG